MKALNRNGSVKLSSYASGIDTSYFKGGGWHYDDQWGTTPFSFTSYSITNGSYEYLAQISLVDIVEQSYAGSDNDLWNTSIQANYNDGMIVKYTSYDDTLSVVYYNLGISFNNYEIGTSGLTNKAIYIDRSVNRAYESSGSIVRAAIAVIDQADTVLNVFQSLMPYTNQSINNKMYFDSTYSAQYSRYNGKVIRGITATTENNRLSRAGHYINVAGTIKYDTSKGTSWLNGYRFSCSANL